MPSFLPERFPTSRPEEDVVAVNESAIKENPSKTPEGVLELPREMQVEWEPNTEEEKVAAEIVQVIRNVGGEAYFTGGYGRDFLMSQDAEHYPDFRFKPHDIDIATNFAYEQVQDVLKEAGYGIFKETGKNFKVLKVYVEIEGRKIGFDVASFRTDGSSGTNRKPTEVNHTVDIREDVARRDFTCGGLYFDPLEKKVIDYVGGIEDIKNRVLKTIGDPYERLVVEDPLRMLRYIRFLTKFNMKFDRTIKGVIQENAHVLNEIPAERLKQEEGELDRILMLPRAAFGLATMARVGILKEVLPEISDLLEVRHTPEGKKASIHKEGNVFRHELETMRAISRPEFLSVIREKFQLSEEFFNDGVVARFYQRYGSEWAWAALLHDVGKGMAQESVVENDEGVRYRFHGHEADSVQLAEQIFNRFRFPKKAQEEIRFLVGNHTKAHNIAGARGESLRKNTRNELFRSPYAEELIFLSLADDMGNFASERSIQEKLENFNQAWRMLKEFRQEEKARQEALAKQPDIGKQVMDLFIPDRTRKKQGFSGVEPMRNTVRLLLEDGRITPDEIGATLRQIKDVLDAKGIDYRGTDAFQLKTQIQEALQEYYKF